MTLLPASGSISKDDIEIEHISDISDVTLVTLASGDTLKWNGTEWVNANNVVYLNSTNTFNTLIVNDFTKLGTAAPSIKMKKITGTSPSAGNSTSYAHGLSGSKILSLSVLIYGTDGHYYPPHHGIQDVAPEYYFAYVSSNYLKLYIRNNSTWVASRAFTCLITYEE